MAIAKVFKSGNSQAVRLPKEFRISADEVEIFRRGSDLILRPKEQSLKRAFELLCELSDDMLDDIPDDPPQVRAGL